MEQRTLKEQIGQFGRTFALLLNRSMMYQKSHPFIQESITDVHTMAELVLYTVSPLVFILNRDHFYLDEEPLDPRINVKRTVGAFKSAGIQSISFERGLTKGELGLFIEAFAMLGNTFEAEAMKRMLATRGVYRIKINHVLYRKVTEDDQVVSREALRKVTPMMAAEDRRSRKKFLDTLLESVLAEEFADTLNITNLLNNPGALSRKMIEADLAGVRKFGAGAVEGGFEPLKESTATESGASGVEAVSGEQGQNRFASGSGSRAASMRDTDPATGQPAPHDEDGSAAVPTGNGHGALLLHQLEMMHREVKKHLNGEGGINLTDLAQAIFEMKKKLLEGLKAQKALGVAYANEAAIVDNANALTDQVLIGLIKEEYRSGAITTQRLAMMITRLIPSADELRRLLPAIKTALIEEGMAVGQYLKLIHDLQTELQNDALARVLRESAETIGVDSDALIEEVTRNPAQAAELIYLASEIRKGGADETALSEILVDYVERLGEQMVRKDAQGQAEIGDGHLEKVITDVESTILKQLGRMNVQADVLERIEKRINARMDNILDKMRAEWINAQGGRKDPQPSVRLSVLQTLEHNINDNESLGTILRQVRLKVESGEIDENDFSRIYAAIVSLEKAKDGESQIPPEILDSEDIMFILEKEIAKSRRYNSPFTVLAISFVSAKPQMKSLERMITIEAVLESAFETLIETFREVDYIGRIGKNKILVILPMIDAVKARFALERVLRLLHSKPITVRNIPVQIRVAGVVSAFDGDRFSDARTFARHVSGQLMDMVSRVKNIQVLF